MKVSTQRLLAAAVLLLLSLGAARWWSLSQHSHSVTTTAPAATAPVSLSPPAAPARPSIAPLMKAEKGLVKLEAPPEKQDKYAGLPVIAQKESVQPVNGLQQVTRVRLLRDPSFKYPILRVEDELVRGPDGDRLIRQLAMVGDHVLVKPADPDLPEADLLALLESEGATLRKKMPASGTWLIAFAQPDTETVPRLVTKLGEMKKLIRYAEPDYLRSTNALPNDPSFANLWGLHNTGQNGGLEDADIDAPEAWTITTGSHAVKVAIIDSGIDQTHPDLLPNLWTNPHEIPGNGIDDDGNGYIDDIRGWDFVNDDAIPNDDNSHGTHCAGTVGAAGNNGAGVTGVNWAVSLIGLKFLNAAGNGATSDAVEAIAYATSLGVHIMSNSWSGEGYSTALKEAIDAAGDAGILFIAAAGNSGSYLEFYPEYPASYDSANLITVTATNRLDALASFSNYGEVSVDIAAPGEDVYSTIPGGGYGYNSGTSMACPHVAGACAILLAHRPSLTHLTLRDLILDSSDALPVLAGKTTSGGRLNLHSALLATDDVLVTPGATFITAGAYGGPFSPASKDYTVSNNTQNTATWTASADRPWVTVSPPQGSLSPGEDMTLTVSVNDQAAALPPGTHIATLTLTNPGTGRSQVRSIALQVNSYPVYDFPLDTDPGWPRTGEWAFGTPQGGGGTAYGRADPKTGATGSNVFGINLAGDYSTAVGQPQYLTAGPFDLSAFRNVKLRFQRWLNSDYQTWVYATIQVSTDGSTWNQVWSNSGTAFGESAWRQMEHEIAAFADGQPEVYVRWGHHVANAGAFPYSGWNLDDIQILASPMQQLVLDLPDSVTEGGSPAQATVTVSPAPPTDLTVTLTSSRPDQEVSFPPFIIIPAGQVEATFALTPIQDTLADGTQFVTLTATAPDYPASSRILPVHDDEQATLTLTLPASLQEGSGMHANVATLSLPTPAQADILIQLQSSDTTELIVPPTVTIPLGQQSVFIPLLLPDDAIIDGPQSVTVTATVTNWPVAQATLIVTDNEPLHLSLTLPSQRLESAGLLPGAGTVTASGILASPLTVTLTSDDPSELIVPPSVVILAGTSSTTFDLHFQDDDLPDGDQTVQVTASSPSFTPATASIIVADDEAPALPVQPNPADGQNPVHPKSTLTWQYDPHSGGIPDSYDIYFGTSPLADELLGNSTSPAWALPLPGLTATTTYHWRIVSRLAGTTRSGPVWSFTTPPVGALHHFLWDPTPAAVALGVPFPVRVTAVDENDLPLDRYESRTPLTAQLAQPETATGTGTYPWTFPLATNYHDARTQSIYTPAEAGPAGRLTALAFQITKPPGQPLTDFTIRLRHTTKTDYLSGGLTWESDGWTTVHAGTETLSAYGWTWFTFTTPFDYDGTSNLMVDFSYNNASFSTDGTTRTTIISNYRTLAFRTDSAFGDPLTWSGTYPESPAYNGLPNLRFQRADVTIPLDPELSGPYAHATWTGQLSLLGTAQGVRLKAADPADPAISGLSAPINVIEVAPFTLNEEPPFTGGTTNLISGTNLGGGYEYEIQRATLPDFSNAASTGYISTPEHLFTNLLSGQAYHYRGRARTGGALGPWSPVLQSTQDNTPPVITFLQPTGSFTPHPVIDLSGTGTDAHSGISSITVNGSLTLPPQNFPAWTAQDLPLTEGPNTFTVTATDQAVPPNITHATWVITRITNPDQDGNQNGISALLEYAFHTNGSPPAEKLPTITTEKDSTTGKTHLILSYHRLLHNPSGLTYSIETSSNMHDWSPLEAPVEVLSTTPDPDGMTELVKVRLQPSLDTLPRRFARLQVSTPAAP